MSDPAQPVPSSLPGSTLSPSNGLDRADPLARFRDEFFRPAGKIYLDGNSLGLLSRRSEASLQRTLDQWRTLAIDAWLEANPPWLTLSENIAEKIAPLVGAEPDELCLTGQTTANLHQLLATLFDPTNTQRRILLGDALNFSSDRYALQSHLRLRGLNPACPELVERACPEPAEGARPEHAERNGSESAERACCSSTEHAGHNHAEGACLGPAEKSGHLRLVPSRDGRLLWLEDILNAFTDDVQIVVLPAVVFTSGQLLDIATLTRKAHQRGILVGWDLSHSIGAVPHALDRDGVDFAFWCNYKWLNGGPGAVGGLYLNRRHFARAPGLAGWWGVRTGRRFAMAPEHEPAPGAAALHIGTPHLLSLAPLLGSLEVISEAGGITALRAKSLALTDFLIAHIDAALKPLGFEIVTPRSHHARGGHLAVAHSDAWRMCQALKAAGVVADFRAPDLIRLAPSPLYTSFADCAEAVARLRAIATAGTHKNFPAAPAVVP